MWCVCVLSSTLSWAELSQFHAGQLANTSCLDSKLAFDGWDFLRFSFEFVLFVNFRSFWLFNQFKLHTVDCTKVKVFCCSWDFLPCSDQPTPSAIDYVSWFLRLVRSIGILLFLSTGDVQLVAGRWWWRLGRVFARLEGWKKRKCDILRTFVKKMQKIESIVSSVSSLVLL